MIEILKETERFKYFRENIMHFKAIIDKSTGKRTEWNITEDTLMEELNDKDFDKYCESLEYI